MIKKTIPFRPTFSDNAKSKYGAIIQKTAKMPSFLKIECPVISALYVPAKHQKQSFTGWVASSGT